MKKNLISTIKRFFSPLKKSPKVYIRGFLIYLNWGVGYVIHILFLQKLIFAVESKNIEFFNILIILYLLYFFYFYLFEFFMKKHGRTDIPNQIVKDIQEKYIEKYVRLDNNFTEKYGVGKSIGVIDKGLEKWGEVMNFTFDKLTSIVVSLIFTSYMLFSVEHFYTLIFIFVLIIFYFIAYFFNGKCLKYRRFKQENKVLYTKQLVKILMSKNEIFQSNKVKDELKKLDYYNDQIILHNKGMSPFIYGLFRVPDAIVLMFLILIFYFLGGKVLSGEITLSVLVGVSSSIIIVQRTIELFLDYYKNVSKEFVVIENLWDFFDNVPEIKGYDTGNNFECKKGSFSIKNINYSYNESKKIFDNFSLEIEGEKILAIVGNSGSGKSTLVKLLSGYIRQDSGDLIVDSQNLNIVSLKSYYENIGYLNQDPSVFDGTIRENLTYSVSTKISDQDLNEIIKLSKCEFIYELPLGLNTEIGERGVKLSGGQKQRLAIAKIMLKNPKIIMLDEPTSALDSFSEDQITKAMHNLFKNRTVIIIAHRLQTVKHADRIIVLEDGKIIEDGNHTCLVKKGGVYSKMLELQSGF